MSREQKFIGHYSLLITRYLYYSEYKPRKSLRFAIAHDVLFFN